MFERDYLMRMLIDLAKAISLSLQKARGEKDIESAAMTLENSIGQATDLDGSVLLTLAPESIAQVLKVSNTDPRAVIYIAHSMLLQSHYLEKLNDFAKSDLRKKQAYALASAYNFDLPEDITNVDLNDFDEEEFLKSIEDMCDA